MENIVAVLYVYSSMTCIIVDKFWYIIIAFKYSNMCIKKIKLRIRSLSSVSVKFIFTEIKTSEDFTEDENLLKITEILVRFTEDDNLDWETKLKLLPVQLQSCIMCLMNQIHESQNTINW